MAEKVIRNNQSLVPFFGERLSFIRGLDPLGLQNTSDATFSMLLPGLNNVTGRIRYYRFYCWLLDEYSKNNGSTNPEDQKRFIRRAEYIIALSAQFIKDYASNIPGSNYANKELQNNSFKRYDLQAGTFKADGTTAETYWNYSFGAFGQYYLGSLRDIGVISNRENQAGLYVRTNSQGEDFISGEMIAAAFDKNISTDIKQVFLSCIEVGSITEEQLISLLPEFDLTLIPSNTEEHELLLKLLLQKDYPLRIEEEPSTLRKETLKHLIRYLKSNKETFNDRVFVYHAYNEKGKVDNNTDKSLMGWYYYQFNEFWHYANTSIFNGTLAHLERTAGPNWQPLKSFIEDIVKQLVEVFVENQWVSNEGESITSLLEKLDAREYDFLEQASKSNGIEKIANGFLLFFTQYVNNYSELFSLKLYSEVNDLGKDGEGPTYFLTQFAAKKELSVKQFLFEYLYQNIIYRHQYVAFRKIRGGALSTQKFIIEEHHIRYLGNFEAGYTGPRLGNLIKYMQDLEMINLDHTLTDKGVSVLNSFSND